MPEVSYHSYVSIIRTSLYLFEYLIGVVYMNKELYPCVFIKETYSRLLNCDLCTWCIFDWYSRRDQRDHKAHEVGVWDDACLGYKLQIVVPTWSSRQFKLKFGSSINLHLEDVNTQWWGIEDKAKSWTTLMVVQGLEKLLSSWRW